MSLSPLLQALEARMIRPTISVLTNIRDDHREEFGLLPDDRVQCMCSFFPGRSTLVSNEQLYGDRVGATARGLSTRVITARGKETTLLPDLPHGVVEENVLLALAVCKELRIEQDAALPAILAEARRTHSPLYTLTTSRGCLQFLNGFAVNDVSSAGRFLADWQTHAGPARAIAVVLNTRADRPLRSLQFAAWCGTLRNLEHVVVTGTHRARTRRALREYGVNPARITIWSSAETRDPVRALQDLPLPEKCLVVGLGNIAGDGSAIVEGMRRWS